MSAAFSAGVASNVRKALGEHDGVGFTRFARALMAVDHDILTSHVFALWYGEASLTVNQVDAIATELGVDSWSLLESD